MKGIKSKIDTGLFNAIIIIISIAFIGGLLFSGSVSIEGVTSNIGGTLLNLVIYLIVIFGFEFFERGFGTNVRDEIYEQNNVAASIYQFGFKIGIALVIAKGLI